MNSNGSVRNGIDDDEAEGDDEDSNVNCNTAGTNMIINKTLDKKLICSNGKSSSSNNGSRHCNKNLKCNKNDIHGGKNGHETTFLNGDTNKTTAFVAAAHQ